MSGWPYLFGRMLGFGTAGGVRPALTLAIIGAMDRLHIGPRVAGPFLFLHHWVAIIVFFGLAILETKFDGIPAMAKARDQLLMPWRVAAGAVAAAATIGHGTTGLVAGLLVGAVAAWLGHTVRHGARPRQPSGGLAFTLVSLSEDLFAFVGALATGLYALLGYALFVVNTWLLAWLRLRRRHKYRVPRAQGE